MAPKDGYKPGHGGSIHEPVLTEVPDGIPRHRGDGRPWIRRMDDRSPAPGVTLEADRWVLRDQRDSRRGAYYSRASSAGSDLEDEFRLNRWKLRTAVQGMTRDAALLARGQSWPVLDQDEPGFSENRDRWDSLADQAIDAGKGGVGAAQGTAFHLLTERRDRGEDLSYLPENLKRALGVWDRMMALFDVRGTEQFVVYDELGIGGTYDRFLCPLQPLEVRSKSGVLLDTMTPDQPIIGDLKSGRTAKYFGPKYCMQQLPYARGVPYSHQGGRSDWPGGTRPNQRWAVVPHVSHQDGGATARLYWVDLDRARAGFELREQLRAFRRSEMFHMDPTEFGDQVPAEVHKLGLIGMIRAAESESDLDRLYAMHEGFWDEDCDRMARLRWREMKAKGQPS